MRCTAIFLLSCLLLAAAEIRLADDFAKYPEGTAAHEGWQTNAVSWQTHQGRLRSDWPGQSEAFVRDPRVFRTATVEVTMIPRKSSGKEWKVAGLVLKVDARNYWHLALVESPQTDGNKHFVELSEMRNGQWLSQGNLKGTAANDSTLTWAYDTPYRLRLTINPKGIDGKVLDLQGKTLAHLGYAFTAPAITEGRAGLKTSWITADFDDFSLVADGGTARVPTLPAEKTFPAYAVKGSGRAAPVPGNGFFQVVKKGERWWLVDPRGELFYAVGTDHVNFYSHWCQELGYAPYHKNAEKRHGTVEKWGVSATERLRKWGFNLVAAGNIAEVRYQGLSHTLFVAFGSMFSSASSLVEKVHWTGFPNVFDPRWEAYCLNLAETQCLPNRNDPWMLGYFLDNELEWYGKTHQPDGIWTATMQWQADHTGKRALVSHVRQAHTDLAEFNRVWEQKVASWDDVLELKALPAISDRAKEVQLAFLAEVADRYFRISTAAIRKVDPNHLIIGSRFAGNAPEWAWKACAKYCDVVSFNNYPRVDMATEDLSHIAKVFTGYYEMTQKPMMITEWSFPALDAGLPCTHGAGMRVDTQEQKTHCVEMMQHLHFRLPFMVGSDYFMWADEPKEGISDTFPEDSNYGLNNVEDKPYELLTGMFTKLNPLAVKMHAGEVPEGYIEELKVEDGKLSLTIRNAGTTQATFAATIRAGGKVLATPRIGMSGGATGTMSINNPLPPGIHVVKAELVEGRWGPRGCRGRSAVTACVAVPGPGVDTKDSLVLYNPTGQDLAATCAVLFPPDKTGPLGSFKSLLTTDKLGFPATWIGPGALTVRLPALASNQALAGRLEAPARPTEAVEYEKLTNGGFRIDNGILRLAHDGASGNVIDRIQVGDVPLGSYNPLIWQEPKDYQWTKANAFVKAEFRAGPALIVDVTSEYRGGEAITAVDDAGKMPDPAAAPATFRITHRFVVWPDCPYIAARLVSIKNLEKERPLRLKAYFFYLPSAIGGDGEDDLPKSGANNVPNYYRRSSGAAWYDAKAKARFGVTPLGEGLVTHFWLDKGNGQHPDARVEIKDDLVLGPGKEYTAPANAPVALIYGATDATWPQLERQLDAATSIKLMTASGK